MLFTVCSNERHYQYRVAGTTNESFLLVPMLKSHYRAVLKRSNR